MGIGKNLILDELICMLKTVDFLMIAKHVSMAQKGIVWTITQIRNYMDRKDSYNCHP